MLSYLLLQIPAAILAERWSATKTVFILMFFWGFAAIWTGLAQTTTELIIACFVLGIFEGGVQLATLVLMLKWFPQREKARASGFWLLCIPLSAIIAAPLTGFLLDHFTWRTVLIIEGIPPIIWAFVWILVIADTPKKAWWMSNQEKDYIKKQHIMDEVKKLKINSNDSPRYRDVFLNNKILILVGSWFLYCAGFYGFTMWLPQVITNFSNTTTGKVGNLTAIPYLVGWLGIIIISILSYKCGLNKKSALVPLSISAIGLLLGQFFPNATLQLVFLCIVASGLYIHGAFFALPPLILRSSILPLALGLIGGIGNLGGFFGPYVVGWLIDFTSSTLTGFIIMAVCLFYTVLVLLQ